MVKSLRVGIIGTGRAGRCQARAFARLPDVGVTALWNRTRAKAERLAADLKAPGLTVFDDWRRMIDRSRVDIISIATDPVLRLEPFAYALAHGRHVLVEKPLAWDLPEAEAMARAAGEAETVTAISFNWRYSPACLTLWRALREGQIGKLLDIQTEWRLCFSPGLDPWIANSGVLRELGSHEFDRARHLTGWQFLRLSCSLRSAPVSRNRTRSGRKSPETFASVLAETSDGAVGNIRLMISPGQPERRIVLGGVEGTLTLPGQWVTLPQDQDSQRRMTLCNELQVIRQRFAGQGSRAVLEVADSDCQPAGGAFGTAHLEPADCRFCVSRSQWRPARIAACPTCPHISDGLDGTAADSGLRSCPARKGRWIDLAPTH